MLILIVAGGPDKGRIYELLDGQEVVLGREGDQIHLNDPKCSRTHARLWSEGGRWYLEDLHSTHGTYRNHKKIDGKTALKDGDYLQVGNTVLVLARMTGTMAERTALLGDPERAATFTPKMQKLLIGGGAIAAAVLLGINTATYFKTSSSSEKLSTQLTAVADDPQRAAFEDEVRTMLAEGKDRGEVMSTMLAKLGPEQRKTYQQLDRQLDSVLAAVESDDTSDVLVAKFDEVLTTMQKQGGQSAALANRMLAAIAAQPTADQLAAATADRVAKTMQPLDPEVVAGLSQAAERLAAVDMGSQIGTQVDERFAELRGMIEKMPGQLSQPMGQVMARLETLDTEADRTRLIRAIDALRKQLPPDPTGKLDIALAKLEDAPTKQELAALSERLAALPTLGDLEAVERRGVERMTTLAALIEERTTTDGTPAAPDLTGIETQLAEVSTRLDEGFAPRNDDALLAKMTDILDELKDRPDADLISEQLAALAENRPAPESPVLAQILDAVKERAVTDQKVDALLAKLEASPYENDALVKEIVAALPQQEDEASAVDTDTLAAQLSEKVTEQFAKQQNQSAEQLRTIIRQEVLAAVQTLDLAGDAAMASADDEVNADGLTRTEEAYKLAFETGQKVTLGGGLNSATGVVDPGRVLDPAAARAAGMTNWRDWYLMDDMAHRMRIARQASRVRGTVGDPSIISLPDATAIYATPPVAEERPRQRVER